ncbi:MAG: aminoglycoside phosphotransferase family protein [Rhodospirillaceae bacterium]|nr:aminoglycoside phosphotransferase family protein [Rhodospirillaceae bacterium]
MTDELDPDAIAERLRHSGHAPGLNGDDLSVHSTKGVSHDHWRVADTGMVLRIPRMNQWGLRAEDALAYQAAAFERAAASGHTPQCIAVMAPDDALLRGALLVEEIAGRAPHLPRDLPAIADALAAIHSLPVPAGDQLPPLQVHRNPVSSTLQTIEEQAAFLAKASLDPESEAGIRQDLDWARDFAGQGEPNFAPCLVCTDAHPGNFLIDDGGKAWFVDLEKALYGAVPIDLAHVTLLTSTGWDPDCRGDLTADDVELFYQHYLGLVGRERAAELGPWLLPLRRLTWLRTITWFARWKAEWSDTDHAAMRDSRMAAHIRAHVERCFEPGIIVETRRDWLA